MDPARILILGGTGNTGRPLAELLLRESDVQVVLASRHADKASAVAAEFNGRFAGRRASAVAVDAAKPATLDAAFRAVDFVVVTASTVAHTRNVATAALAAGIDYLDVQYSAQKMTVLQAMADEIRAAGRCFITDGGFHPGLPAALIRYVAPHFDRLERVRVGSVIQIDWRSLDVRQETMQEFVSEFMDFRSLVFRDGQWRELGLIAMMKPEMMDFGREFGRRYCLPMFLEEMRALPAMVPGLQETGFYVGGFNWFTDWLVSPVVMLGLRLAPQGALGPMAQLMRWSLNTFSRPPYGTLLKVEARGIADGRAAAMDITLFHPDGYWFTAAPVAACLLQLLEGDIRRPGLHLQAHIVEPVRLLADMERMGIEVQTGSGPGQMEPASAAPPAKEPIS